MTSCASVCAWIYGCNQFILAPRAENASKKESSSLFFEKQLEYLDDGIVDKVETPDVSAPRFIGMECVDKVTGFRGMCIGRYVWLFNCDQYVLEYQPNEKTRETKFNILDEGRIEIVPNSTKEIHPEEVASPRPGGIFDPDYYPRADVPIM